VKLGTEFNQKQMARDFENKKNSSWPGLTRPPSAHTSVRAGHPFESSMNLRQLTGFGAAPTRVRWVAGSSPAMTKFFQFEIRRTAVAKADNDTGAYDARADACKYW
jgi:hypothetical protein